VLRAVRQDFKEREEKNGRNAQGQDSREQRKEEGAQPPAPCRETQFEEIIDSCSRDGVQERLGMSGRLNQE
jgi:hypothetical protein